MTTDRDTLRKKLEPLVGTNQDGTKIAPYLVDNRLTVAMQLIDDHANALKEQTETDILGRLPASSRTCTCTTCRVVTDKLNKVFSYRLEK